MNLDTLPLAELQVFAQVVHQHSFAGAARQMQLTTSAVSRSVSRLEQQLGVKLLQRTTRSLSLTEVGAEVYAASTRMLQSAEQALSLAAAHRQQPQGVLRISAPIVFGDLWLAPLIPGFCAQWPEVHVQLAMSDAMVDMAAEGIDLAIRITTADALPPAMVARPLRSIRYVLAAHPAYVAAHAPIASPADLAHHPCMSLGYGPFQNIVDLQPGSDAAIAEATPPVRVRLNTPITIASSLGLLQALIHGAPDGAHSGIGLLADFVAQPCFAAGTLAQVLPGWQLAGSYAPRMAYAVYAPGPHIPPKLRAMLDYLLARNHSP